MAPPASHVITVDPARKLVEVRLETMVGPEDAGWIGEEVRAAVRSLGADVIGQHVTLYDASAIKLLPSATIELLRDTFSHPQVRPLWARKVAFVVTTGLARRQANRVREARSDIALFEDRETAIAWLMTE